MVAFNNPSAAITPLRHLSPLSVAMSAQLVEGLVFVLQFITMGFYRKIRNLEQPVKLLFLVVMIAIVSWEYSTAYKRERDRCKL